ncbi:hypothetical protein BZG36_03483 [Bifiguratus adelaidae]|uniref:Eukaryotic translation initiation factor 3 subunit C n=1 Tax=Bifiguratus adelaidae TaxID=1938954 RepID=A0A261XWP5_9FUNG|nr:hypothetical protein BZG36_03483 [Bifiguratus adelaidae]
MSRFFRSASDSESETSSSDNESFISDEELSDEEQESEDEGGKTGKSRWLVGAGGDSSDEDDEEEESGKKKVKSAKDKRYEEMEDTVKAMENAQKINDWVAISTEFDKLNRQVTKASNLMAHGVPRFYIKAIAELDDFLQDAVQKEKAAKKKMNANNAKALNAMKQKLKKNNKQYEEQIERFRKNLDEEEEESEVAEEPEVEAAPKKGINKYLSSIPDEEGVAEEMVDDAAFTPIGKGGKVLELTQENLFKKLREVMEARGRKNTDRTEQINILQRLLTVAVSPYQKIKVLLALISAQFDTNVSATGYMNIELWKDAEREINQLYNILEESTQFVVRDDVEDFDDGDKDYTPAPGEPPVALRGSVASFVDRLDDEFTKSLQHIDPHTTEYVDRLKDETGLYALIVRSIAYLDRLDMQEHKGRAVMRRLEHLYYKPDQVIRQVEETVRTILPEKVSKHFPPQDSTDLIHSLCVELYQQTGSLLRTRAMLCHIYHHALHNRFYQARDMLLMSHLQESIHQADVGTQILHNRATVQVGLCAFRQGLIKESQTCLQEISGSGRPKELLAQGIQMQRYTQLTAEQEQADRQRQLPFHMHINLELLECVYLTCSMLLEIPSIAAAGPGSKKIISKPFRRLLEYNERQVFSGPPENTRDHIMGAARALASGEWRKAKELMIAIKIWDLIPGNDKIKEMLAKKIQEEGLRTYIFTYASYYSTLGFQQLSDMFDLPINQVSSIISKMIWNEEVAASLDQIQQCVVLHQVELSKVQELSLQFADKAAALVEHNERILEQKSFEQKSNGSVGPTSGTQGRTSGGKSFQKRTGTRNVFNNVLGNSVRSRASYSGDLQAAPYPPDFYPGGQYLKLPQGTMRYYKFGPEGGAKIAFVHGISLPSPCFAKVAWTLVDHGYQVLLYDTWGRGYSDAPSTRYDEGLHVSQLAMLLSHVGWDKEPGGINLLGYSMGGAIATSYTAFWPHVVKRLILAAPAGLIAEDSIPFGGRLMKYPAIAQLTLTSLVRPIALKLILKHVARPNQKLLTYDNETRDFIQTIADIGAFQMSHHPGIFRAFFGSISAFPVSGLDARYATVGQNTTRPTLVIWGENDHTVPYKTSKTLKDYIPSLQLVSIPDEGHGIFMTNFNDISNALRDFLIAKETAKILRSTVSTTRWSNETQLIEIIKHVGRTLSAAQPQELAIMNIVRRVLKIIRELARGEVEEGVSRLELSDEESMEDEDFADASDDSTDDKLGDNSLVNAFAMPQTSRSNYQINEHPDKESGDGPKGGMSRPLLRETTSMFNLLGDVVTKTPEHQMKVNVFKPLIISEIKEEIISELDTVYKEIADQALEHIYSNEVILTIGRSTTVERFLKKAATKRKFSVFVVETAPTYQGHDMALELSKAGIDTTVITDAAVYAVMSRVHKVIVGAHAVLGNGALISVAGTATVAAAATHQATPVIVCTALFKVSPTLPYDTDVFNMVTAPDSVMDFKEGDLIDKVSVINPYYDYVRPELISLFVHNLGSAPPSYIYRLINDSYDAEDFGIEADMHRMRELSRGKRDPIDGNSVEAADLAVGPVKRRGSARPDQTAHSGLSSRRHPATTFEHTLPTGIEEEREELFHERDDVVPDGGLKAWLAVVSLFTSSVFVDGFNYCWGLYQEAYLKDAFAGQISATSLTWAGNILVATYIALGPFATPCIYRYGVMRVILAGNVICLAALIAASFAQAPVVILLTHGFLMGVGCTFVYYPTACLPSQWFKKKRGLANGIGMAGAGFGGLILSPLTQYLIDAYGWRWALRITAAIFAVLGVVIAVTAKERIPMKLEGFKMRMKLEDIFDISVVKSWNMVLLLWMELWVPFGYYQAWFLLPSYCSSYGISPSIASVMVGVLSGSNATGKVMMGFISDKFGKINTLFMSTLLSGASYLFIWGFANGSIAAI